jgi:hypothetical protein
VIGSRGGKESVRLRALVLSGCGGRKMKGGTGTGRTRVRLKITKNIRRGAGMGWEGRALK